MGAAERGGQGTHVLSEERYVFSGHVQLDRDVLCGERGKGNRDFYELSMRDLKGLLASKKS